MNNEPVFETDNFPSASNFNIIKYQTSNDAIFQNKNS